MFEPYTTVYDTASFEFGLAVGVLAGLILAGVFTLVIKLAQKKPFQGYGDWRDDV